MTDEMRIALVGIAMGAGLADFTDAWALVGQVADDNPPADPRELAQLVADRARKRAWGSLAS